MREAQLQNTSGTSEGCLDPCSQTDKCENGGICRDSVSSVWCDCNGTRFEGVNCTDGRYGQHVLQVLRGEEFLSGKPVFNNVFSTFVVMKIMSVLEA